MKEYTIKLTEDEIMILTHGLGRCGGSNTLSNIFDELYHIRYIRYNYDYTIYLKSGCLYFTSKEL